MGIFKKGGSGTSAPKPQSEISKEFDRFSNYGDVVDQKFANTGWEQSTPDTDPFMPTEGWNS